MAERTTKVVKGDQRVTKSRTGLPPTTMKQIQYIYSKLSETQRTEFKEWMASQDNQRETS
ncbi:hypothetical protein VCHA38O209_50271 [Vibrio chagasii]|nr:hypothetical protein VCHA38O209_50271 [Vibrio chagasii]